MTPAAALTNRIKEAVSRHGARLFPMTVGKFWAGQVVKTLPDGSVILKNPRMVNVGTQGMSDLVGFTPVVITPEMVGSTLAVYAAAEVKAGKDTLKPGQRRFIDFVNENGGRAGVARSPEDAIRICSGQDQNGMSSS